jgi:hypothetical protein
LFNFYIKFPNTEKKQPSVTKNARLANQMKKLNKKIRKNKFFVVDDKLLFDLIQKYFSQTFYPANIFEIYFTVLFG